LIVKLRQEVGRIDTELEGKSRTRAELDQRAQETRANLEAIKRDPAANALRKRLSDRLEQFAKDGDKLGRDLVELQTKRTEKKVALEDLMQNLDLTPPKPLSPKK
jgi:predicted  nucleic acid-binding Zn-ribbon protein